MSAPKLGDYWIWPIPAVEELPGRTPRKRLCMASGCSNPAAYVAHSRWKGPNRRGITARELCPYDARVFAAKHNVNMPLL